MPLSFSRLLSLAMAALVSLSLAAPADAAKKKTAKATPNAVMRANRPCNEDPRSSNRRRRSCSQITGAFHAGRSRCRARCG